MEDSLVGVGRYGGQNRLPTLRQEPVLPVSPPSEPGNSHFDQRTRVNGATEGSKRHRRSRGRVQAEREFDDDSGRAFSGTMSNGGASAACESGKRLGGGEGALPQSEDERAGHQDVRASEERKRKAGVENAGGASCNPVGNERPDSARSRQGDASTSDSSKSITRRGSGMRQGRHEGLESDTSKGRPEKRKDGQDTERNGAEDPDTNRGKEKGKEQRDEPFEEGSTERSHVRRTERTAAEEEERRRRKEERRIKRAEKEQRKAARAQRSEGVSGEDAWEKRSSNRDSNQERNREGRESDREGGQREGGSQIERRKDRRETPDERDSRQERRTEAGPIETSGFAEPRHGPMNGTKDGAAVSEEGLRSKAGGLKNGFGHGANRIGTDGQLGRGMSIINEIYEEADEAMLLHSPFRYDETTGQLTSALASSLPPAEAKKQRLYIEGVTDGNFQRTHTESEQGDGGIWCCWRPATWQRGEAEDDDVELGSPGGIVLRVACEQVAGALSLLAHLSNSLLGGFALLNFYLTYLYNAGTLPGGFLGYYTPVAISCQRTFLLLSSICLLAACDKYAKDKLAEWQPRGNVQWRHDLLVILSFFLAFVLSVVGTPFEDYIFQENKNTSDWYSTVGSTAHFKARLKLWHVLNFVRLGACAVGFSVVMLDGSVALRTARAKTLQVARLERTAGAAALANSLARANAVSQSMQATRVSLRS